MTRHVCFVILVLGCIGTGAWLVIQGHPWFALLAMIIGGSVSMSDGPDTTDSEEQT